MSASAHPRLRGEHPGIVPSRVRGGGSSPLTRGAQLVNHTSWKFPGLIPAYAGSTSPDRHRRLPRWAHPRLRGEHAGEACDPEECRGSSPLTRGARHCVGVCIFSLGLIPAYAGSTLVGIEANGGLEAHPRLRGEHDFDTSDAKSGTGSSPLTRGARLTTCLRPHRRRLIPAYAGSTTENPRKQQAPEAHPRLRGEHPYESITTPAHAGSSPLTRGAPVRRRDDNRIRGLIPAYAGSTPWVVVVSRAGGAHPRLRGEH